MTPAKPSVSPTTIYCEPLRFRSFTSAGSPQPSVGVVKPLDALGAQECFNAELLVQSVTVGSKTIIDCDVSSVVAIQQPQGVWAFAGRREIVIETGEQQDKHAVSARG